MQTIMLVNVFFILYNIGSVSAYMFALPITTNHTTNKEGIHMNIYDISEKAGVSIATVSRVLNGNTNVSEKTKKKVLAIMQEYGYTPNAFARGLTANTMHTVGIMCPDSSDPYLAQAVYYMEQNLRKRGYDVLLCCTGYELADKQNYMQLLLAKNVDGIILVSSTFVSSVSEDNEYIKQASEKVPVIILNASLESPNIYSVFCNDEKATEEATAALLQNGRKQILFLYSSHSYSSMKKRSGYEKALAAHGMETDKKLLQYCSDAESITGVKNFLKKLAADGITYDAVVTIDDKLAVGVIKYAKEMNISIPSELEIVGYNNSTLAECCEPELTSVDSKPVTLCKQCSDALITVLAGGEFPNKSVFSAELIKRGTTHF